MMAHRTLTVLCLLIWSLSSTWSFCPGGCGCDDTSLSVHCSALSNLKVVPIFLNPQIKSLTLTQNQIKDITLSLQFYPELKFLDISRNQIESLGKQNFLDLKVLESLNVSLNAISALENDVFTGLTKLIVVDLSGNQIERIEKEVFWNMKSLAEVILDRNRLEFIDWDLFRGLDSLRRISVKYNFIQMLEPSSSSGGWTLPSLRHLDVSSNHLTRVKGDGLRTFSSLVDLNLCCNYIHTLEKGSMLGLGHLLRLNLSQNRLSEVPTAVLGTLGTTLRHLDLSSNRLRDTVPQDAFKQLPHLQILKLDDNPGVYAIHPDAFRDNVNLVSVHANYLPNLTEISSNLLANKPHLQLFSVKYAQISLLSEDVLTENVRAVDLTGNPFECNCSAWPLFQYLEKEGADGSLDQAIFFQDDDHILTHINLNSTRQAQYVDPAVKTERKKGPFYLTSVRCHSPANLRGILVKDLKASDFSACFTPEDNFQVLVICIAATLLSIIFLVLALKLCCWKKLCKKCSNRGKSVQEVEFPTKHDILFDGVRGPLGNPPPAPAHTFYLAPVTQPGGGGATFKFAQEPLTSSNPAIPSSYTLKYPMKSMGENPSCHEYQNPYITHKGNTGFASYHSDHEDDHYGHGHGSHALFATSLYPFNASGGPTDAYCDDDLGRPYESPPLPNPTWHHPRHTLANGTKRSSALANGGFAGASTANRSKTKGRAHQHPPSSSVLV